jgi:leucyl-tRNA synthetase
MERYEPKQIEPKWQRVWEDAKAFETPNPEPDETGEESHWYQLEMLPYPSGTLHMGHVLNYTMGDVATHFRRRNGWTVLRPMGFDSFGLPAENAAITEGGHPREITDRNILAIRKQMQRLGWAIDWKREISAHEVDFYRWTQWLFLQFYRAGLAYRSMAAVDWCPKDNTTLAREQVIGPERRCERMRALATIGASANAASMSP